MGRLACWIIVAGTEPTAFRAMEREELLPTLRQLQRTQPDATLKWFARGRLWESPEQAQDAGRQRPPKRPAKWRPGGKHVDPRERYTLTRDQKRARFKRRLRPGDAAPSSGERRRPPEGPRYKTKKR
jgi:hypothetical protein